MQTFEYACYTDNLCWGRQLIGLYPTRIQANNAGRRANKGLFIVKKVLKKN